MGTNKNKSRSRLADPALKRPWTGIDDRKSYVMSLGWSCPEVMGNDLSEILRYEGLLDRFNQIVKLCASKGMTTDELFEKLKSSFPNYYPLQNIDEKVFKEICRSVPEIRASWNYGILEEEDKSTMLKNKAFDIAMDTDDLKDIAIYNEMYDKENSSRETSQIGQLNNFDETSTFNFTLTPSNNENIGE